MNQQSVTAVVEGVWQSAVSYFPKLLAAALILAAGWLVAMVLRWAVIRLTARSVRRSPANAVKRAATDSGIDRVAATAIGAFVFWAVFLLFLAAAGQVLGLVVITTALSRLAQHLPNVLAALLVVFAGTVVAKLTRVTVSSTAARAGVENDELLGQAAQAMILLVAGIVALDQVGIESTMLILVTGVVMGSVIGGAALAFGMGARDSVREFIASNDLHRTYRVGDQVRFGSVQGKILEFTKSAVLLETDQGRARVPASELGGTTSFLVEDPTP